MVSKDASLAAGILATEEATAVLTTALTLELVQVVTQEMAGQVGCRGANHQLRARAVVVVLEAAPPSFAVIQTTTAAAAEAVVVSGY